MGEGLYWSRDGHTAYVDLYDHLDPDDHDLWGWACDDLTTTIQDSLSASWWPVEREWRGRSDRVVARNRLHEIWLTEDSYGRVHVTFGVRDALEETDALAWHWLDVRAETFFDALQAIHPLRVRTSPWTSTERTIGRAVA